MLEIWGYEGDIEVSTMIFESHPRVNDSQEQGHYEGRRFPEGSVPATMETSERLESNSSGTKARRQRRGDTRACAQSLESEPHGSVRSLAICLPSDYSIVSFYSGFNTTANELLSPSSNRVAGGTKITHRWPILCRPPECMPISST